VTLRARRDVPSLRSRRFVAEIERSFRAACDRERFRLVHDSIQRDHAHVIVEAASAHALSNGLKSIAARVARAVNRVFGRRGQVLDDRCHVRALKTPREVRNAIAYVLLNARRHAAKLGRQIDRVERIDPASSGRWFDGWRVGPSAIDASDERAVARPRTWILTVGWRRMGLIDPGEIPGRRSR